MITKALPSSEILINRLFSIAQNLPLAANSPIGPWAICQRRLLNFDQVQPEQIPAFFQFQNPVRESLGYIRGVGKDIIGVSWIVYLPKSPDNSTIVSPALNTYYDALSNALLTAQFDAQGNVSNLQAGAIPPMPQAQSLGFPGQILCYKDGGGLTDEGLLSTYSLIHIPIKLQYGMG